MNRYVGRLGRETNVVRVPCWCVYVLFLKDQSSFKVGYSGDWVRRAWGFVPLRGSLPELFDFGRSVSWFVDSKKTALCVEKAVLREFSGDRVRSPYRHVNSPILWGAGGHTEWFSSVVYERVIDAFSAHAMVKSSGGLTLEEALCHEKVFLGAELVGRLQ